MSRFITSLSFLFLIFSCLYINYCVACDGYKLNLISVENCGENDIITLDSNFTTDLSSDCIITSKGCLHSKGFKEAKVKYSIIKNGHDVLSGHPDICNVLDHNSPERKAKLELFGIPTECPVPEGQKCVDDAERIDISKLKAFLPMATGQITANFNVTHDTGTTCAVVKFEITK